MEELDPSKKPSEVRRATSSRPPRGLTSRSGSPTRGDQRQQQPDARGGIRCTHVPSSELWILSDRPPWRVAWYCPSAVRRGASWPHATMRCLPAPLSMRLKSPIRTGRACAPRVPLHPCRFRTSQAAFKALLEKIDWDADGKISLEEWSTMLKEMQMDNGDKDDEDDEDDEKKKRTASAGAN